MNKEVTPSAPVPQPHVPPEHSAVSQANRRSDYWVLAAGVVASLTATGLVFFTSIASVVGGYGGDEYYEESTTDAGVFDDLISFVVIGGIATAEFPPYPKGQFSIVVKCLGTPPVFKKKEAA